MELPTAQEIKLFQRMVIQAIEEMDTYYPIMALLCGVKKDKADYERILGELKIMLTPPKGFGLN